jgi:hypothetical protein
VDLFEPGSGSRVHDFTPGVASSGLVWTVPIPDAALVVSQGGKRLDVDVRDLPVIDATPAEVPATVSFQMTWRGRGRARQLGQGTAVPPTDAAAFLGRFFRARARGTFSGAAGSFTFQSNPKRRARSIFAELGTEQTGALLAGAVRCGGCARSGPGDPGSQYGW